MNTYDASHPKDGTRQGRKPRIRRAKPGSALDEVYRSRYRRIESDEDVVVEFDAGEPEGLPAVDVDAVAQAIADETPPDARPRPVDDSWTKSALVDEALARGLDAGGTKAELLDRINGKE